MNLNSGTLTLKVLAFNRIRRQATNWGKTSTKDTFDKGLLSKIYKGILKLNKKTNNSVKIWAKDLRRHLTREYPQMTKKHRKRC